jgi:peptide/nickel transport system substrate-binding protein
MKMLKVASLSAMMLFTSFDAFAEATNSNQLSDVRVRHAIAYAIDMETIVETLLDGKAIAASSLIPNGPFKPDGLNMFKYNPDKARSLLKAANWDGDRELVTRYYYGDQLTADLMVAIQAYLADVGIKMSFSKFEGDVGAQLRTAPADPDNGPSVVTWDLAYGANGPLALQDYYGSNNRQANTPRDPVNDILVEALNVADIDKQKAAFEAITVYSQEKLNSYALYHQQAFIYESDRVNRNGAAYGNPQYNYDWHIEKWTTTPDANGKMVLRTNTGPIEFFEQAWTNPGLYIYTKVVFDRLITADGGLAPTRGKMAESYSLSDDGLTLSLTLKDGLTWHDGEAITGAEVKWNVEQALKFPLLMPTFKTTFSRLKGAEAFTAGTASDVSGISVDGNNVTFSFAKLDPNLLLSFSQFPLLPQKHLANADMNQFQQNSFWQSPIGSGPYKVKEVQMNDYLVLVPFADYHEGEALIDEIIASPSADNDANLVKNARAGLMDYGFTKNTADVSSIEAMSNMTVLPQNIPYTRILWINSFPRE